MDIINEWINKMYPYMPEQEKYPVLVMDGYDQDGDPIFIEILDKVELLEWLANPITDSAAALTDELASIMNDGVPTQYAIDTIQKRAEYVCGVGR